MTVLVNWKASARCYCLLLSWQRRGWGKQWQTSDRTVGGGAEIRTENFKNRNQKRYRSSKLVRKSSVWIRRNRSTYNIRRSSFVRHWKQRGSRSAIFHSSLCMTHFKDKFCYNILIKFGIPVKLVSLIKLYFNKTFTNVGMGKHMRGASPIWEGLKKCDELSPRLIKVKKVKLSPCLTN
jgi:hypothetical protein